MHWIDWSIVVALLAVLFLTAYYTKRFSQSVADFLAGGRVAGRYVVCISECAAGTGAISI